MQGLRSHFGVEKTPDLISIPITIEFFVIYFTFVMILFVVHKTPQ